MTPEAARVAILLTLVAQNSAQNIFMRFSFKPKNQVSMSGVRSAIACDAARPLLAKRFCRSCFDFVFGDPCAACCT